MNRKIIGYEIVRTVDMPDGSKMTWLRARIQSDSGGEFNYTLKLREGLLDGMTNEQIEAFIKDNIPWAELQGGQ